MQKAKPKKTSLKTNPFFSVVITNWNAMRWLDKCFTSLKNQTFKNFEVILVDNASTDNSLTFVKKKFPWVQIIKNKKDLGYAEAFNVGGFQAQGKYIVAMNTDAYLDNNSLEKLAKHLQKHPELHIMQLDVRKYDKSNMQDKPLMFGVDIFGYPIGYGEMFYTDGASMVIQTDLFKKLNGNDPAFYMYLDDMDLSWRAQLVGEKIYFLKGIYMYHFAGGTSVTTIIKNHSYTTTVNRRFHAQKNNLRALIKNYSFWNIFWSLPISTLLASAEGFLYLTKGNREGFIALHKAIWWNITHLPDTLKERKKVQTMRTVSDRIILSRMVKTISKLYSFQLHGVPNMK